MSRKNFAYILVFALFLLAFFGIPANAHAGGVCGGTYVVDPGDTLDKIAARCGTSVAAILAANPGIGSTVQTGQVLALPGSGVVITSTPVTVVPTATPIIVVTPMGNYNNIYDSFNTYNYNYYNNYDPYGNYNYVPTPNSGNLPSNYRGAYVVQYGDTFSGIANRFGISIYDLWAANPDIWDINVLFAGEIIYLPGPMGQLVYGPTSPTSPIAQPTIFSGESSDTGQPVLSQGFVPFGDPTSKIELINMTSYDVYISLQGTTKSGINFIDEYSIGDSIAIKEPVGKYGYVAWLGGKKYTGSFHLSAESDVYITFYNDKLVIK